METFEEAKVKMQKAGACEDEFKIVSKLILWQEFFEHERAPYWCCWYAHNVIEGRWEPGEEAISKSARFSYLYALYVLKSRWKPGEAAIAKDALYLLLYRELLAKLAYLERWRLIDESNRQLNRHSGIRTLLWPPRWKNWLLYLRDRRADA